MISKDTRAWFVAETLENRIRDVSDGLTGMALVMEEAGISDIRFIVPCSDPADAAGEFTERCRWPVHFLVHPDLYYHQPLAIADFLYDEISRVGSSLVFFCDTVRGSSTASYLAARSNSAFVPRVTGISGGPGDLMLVSRDEMSRTTRKVSSAAASAVATLSSGFAAMDGMEKNESRNTQLQTSRSERTYPFHPVSLSRSQTSSDLAGAHVIIAAGRGMGSQDNLKLVSDIVDIIPGSAIAASRPVCDAGWLPLSCQVGMTGQTVRPGLYMACGISGSAQHLSGMRDSGCIVAINIDPDAPICSVADYCVVEDVKVFLPDFRDACLSIISPYGDVNNTNGASNET